MNILIRLTCIVPICWKIPSSSWHLHSRNIANRSARICTKHCSYPLVNLLKDIPSTFVSHPILLAVPVGNHIQGERGRTLTERQFLSESVKLHTSSKMEVSSLLSEEPSQKPKSSAPKTVAFELLLDEGSKTRARIPLRILVNPHDTTDSIITTVKNFY